MSRIQCDALVIGAGVIGLSAARALPGHWNRVLLESHPGFGRETSSRNSEVIHSGIYYPPQSRKTEWCLEGRRALYQYCEEQGVPFRKTGKLLVACEASEMGALEARLLHAKSVGVTGELWSPRQVREREASVRCEAAGYFPESGIVDSHSFLAALEEEFLASGGTLAYGHTLESLEPDEKGFLASVRRGDDRFAVWAAVVVNAAGLGAAEISNRALGTKRYRHGLCRGRYLNLASRWTNRFRGLVYPMPPKDGLGVHVTLDLSGAARLGPDVDWSMDGKGAGALYEVDWSALEAPFLQAARRYLPDLSATDLLPGLVGVRPKLFVDGEPHSDFLVEAQQRFIHCLGIESPGLTAALPIGETVARLARDAHG